MKQLYLAPNLAKTDGWGRLARFFVFSSSESKRRDITVLVNRATNADDLKGIRQIECLTEPSFKIRNVLLNSLIIRKYAKGYERIYSLAEHYNIPAMLSGQPYYSMAIGTYSIYPLTIPFLKNLFVLSLKKAEKVICISSYTEKRLNRKIKGIRNTEVINPKCENIFRNLNLKRKNIILTVGAIKERKGFEDSIKGIAMSMAKDFLYLAVGRAHDKNYMSHIQRLASRKGVRMKVMTAVNSDEDLLKIYNKARIFLMPSIDNGIAFEGYGIVYEEAQACGLPCIGTYQSGAVDTIKNGILVNQCSPKEIAEAINKILKEKYET